MTTSEKPGVTREANLQDHLWLQGLLRYTRNVTLGFPARGFRDQSGKSIEIASGVVPNILPVFAGFVPYFEPSLPLALIVRSFEHTDHGQYIAQERAAAARANRLHASNAVASLYNSNSPDLGLMVEGCMDILPDETKGAALLAINGIRRLKREDEFTTAPASVRAEQYGWYILRPTAVYTQGERFDPDGYHVGEGHPVIDSRLLTDFIGLPALAPGQAPPRERSELFAHLQAQGYSHPGLTA